MSLQKTDTRKNCPACKRKFSPVRKTAKYCTDACKMNAARKRQATKQKIDFKSLAFGSWLIGQCRRAGTVQILQGFELVELYRLWVRCRRYNGFNVEVDPLSRFELSHVAPVSTIGATGTLHPKNLVITPAYYNRSRCNNWDDKSGVWLRPFDMHHSWKVYPAMTAQEVADKIAKFIPEGLDSLLSDVKLTVSFRVKMVQDLVRAGVSTERKLKAQPYDALLKLYESLQASNINPEKRPFSIDPATPFEVYLQECERLNIEGVTHDEHSLFYANETECWDHLHGGILTVYNGLAFSE